MSQMYKVKFTRTGNATLEVGEAIVNANSAENAAAISAQMLNLPMSETQFECSRIKPQFFLVSRKTAENRMATFDADTVSDDLACRATFPHEDIPDRATFSIAVAAELRAYSETDAIHGAIRVLMRHINGIQQKPSLQNFNISCERLKEEERISKYEENANYTHHQFVQGGAARPR